MKEFSHPGTREKILLDLNHAIESTITVARNEWKYGESMENPSERWWARPQIWVEGFAIANAGFLTFDIYLAHSVNQFRNRAEYIPLVFSATAPLLLILALAVRYRWPAVWKDLGYLVGWLVLFVGFTGVILHLQSHFFL